MVSCPILECGKPVTLRDRPLFQRYFKAYPPQTSEMTFTNIYCWADVKHHLFCEHKGHLILSARGDDGCLQLYPPVGPHPAKIMAETPEHVAKFHWVRIPEHLAHTATSDAKPHYDHANADYVYELEALRSLAGKKYDGKRNFIKRFSAQGPVVRMLKQSDGPACLRIQEQWLESQHGNPSAKNESTAMMEAIEHYDDFDLHGIGAFVGDSLAGFAIGEKLNKTVFVEHFEKGLPGYTGVYPFLLHEFAKSIPQSYVYLNREQDLGIEGIRKSKESWIPHHLERKYTFKVRCKHTE